MIDWRIFWSVLAAMIAFSLISGLTAGVIALGYAYKAQEQVEAVVQHAHQQAAAVLQRQAEDRTSRTLSASQRCIGGFVIDQHGASYVQLTDADHRPVACSGRLAAKPIH